MTTTTAEAANPLESLEEAGVVLTEREKNIVAATTARARALAAASLLEIVLNFDEEPTPEGLIDQVADYAVGAGHQQEMAGIIVAIVVANQG